MKRISLLLMALGLSACAHETTTMDRELALKLADRRDPVIMQSAPPTINIYNGGTQNVASQDGAYEPIPEAQRENCKVYPVYSMTGKIVKYQNECFGSR